MCLHFLIISALCNIMRYSPHHWSNILTNKVSPQYSLLISKYLRLFEIKYPFRFQGSSLRITSVWSAAGCPWSLEKCGMRACSTFTKAISFSKRRRLTVPFLLRVKEPPLGVLASADNPVSHGASGFCRWKKQLRSVEIGRTASARTI